MRTRIPQFVCALLAVAAVFPISSRAVSAQEDSQTDEVAQFDPASQIMTLGDGGDEFYVVRHGRRFSIFAEAVSADVIFVAMEPLGGPTYEHATELTRPVTLTMHDVTLEQIVRKMLDGHSFTYHYADGRLALVRVLPLNAGRTYKTPPAVQSRNRWTEIELDLISSRQAESGGPESSADAEDSAP